MRIFFSNDDLVSRSLSAKLHKAGFAVTDMFPDYTIHLVPAHPQWIVVDGIDSEFERHVINRIAELTDVSIMLHRAGGIQSDKEILVTYGPETSYAVEQGLYRAIVAELTFAKLSLWRKLVNFILGTK